MVDRPDNFIHPTAVIEGEVTMGTGNYIGPFAYLSGPVSIGNHTWIGSHVRIGGIPEVRTLKHSSDGEIYSPKGVVIGNKVVIREAAQIHQGWKRQTMVGNQAFVMNQSYIAHDCQIGSEATLASSVLLAGNVTIGSKANLGLGTTVHQGLSVGTLAMIGMSSVITKDIPAFAKSYGSPARIVGVNEIGMERAGISASDTSLITEIFTEHAMDSTLSQTLSIALPGDLLATLDVL